MYVLLSLLLAIAIVFPPLALEALAKPPTIAEKLEREQQKRRKELQRLGAEEQRDKALRVKLRKARQARRTAVKNGEDPLDYDEEIERLERESGADEE